MSTLGDCLAKAGKAFDASEQQELSALAQTIQTDSNNGVDGAEAARMAVQEFLSEARTERTSFLEQISQQLGDTRPPFQYSQEPATVDAPPAFSEGADQALELSPEQRAAVTAEGTKRLNANPITAAALKGGKLRVITRYDLTGLIESDSEWQTVANNAGAVGAFNRKTGEAVLLSDRMVSEEDFVPVAMHELLHEAQEYANATADQQYALLLGDEREALVTRLKQLTEFGNAKEQEVLSRARELFEGSSARDLTDPYQSEEFLAYVVQAATENSEATPDTVMQWVKDLMAAVLRGTRRVMGLAGDPATMSLDEFITFTNTVFKDRAGDAPTQSETQGVPEAEQTPEIREGNAWTERLRAIEQNETIALSENPGEASIDNTLGLMERVVARAPMLLGTLNRRHIADIAPANMTAAKGFVRDAEQMDADRNALLSQAGELLGEWHSWARRNKQAAQRLFDIMHQSTIAGVDPSQGYTPLITEAQYLQDRKVLNQKLRNATGTEAKQRIQDRLNALEDTRNDETARRKARPMLDVQYRALTKDAKKYYARVRDTYMDQNDQLYSQLKQRVDRAEMSDNMRRQLQDKLRISHESQKTRGPYFPLMRFGDYWAAARDKRTGELVEYQHFDSPKDARKYREEMNRKGYKTTIGAKRDDSHGWGQVDEAYASSVQEAIKDQEGVSKASKLELADQVWQLYLQTLPEMNIRKQHIHRKKTAGWNEDAMRAYAQLAIHSAHHITKIKHGDTLTAHVKQAALQAAELQDSTYANRVVEEMEKSFDWAMNPTANPLAQVLNSIGFIGYLGVSPAAAAVNMIQVPMVSLPMLGARFGFTKAAAELLKTSREFAGLAGTNVGKRAMTATVFLDQNEKKHYDQILKGEEKDAYDELVRRGRIDKTRAHDVAGVAELGLGRNQIVQLWMERIAAPFHNAEVFNREVTAIAAYRLARKSMGHAGAIDYADKTVQDSQFDYSNAARPRMLRSAPAKVIGQFKQFAVNMTYLVMRDVYVATGQSSDLSKEEVAEVRRRAIGMWSMSLFMGGMSGVPIYSMVMGVVNGVMNGLGEDDETFDAPAEFRTALAETFGPDWADVIMAGPIDKYFQGSVSTRVSPDLWKMWVQGDTQGYEGREEWAQILMQLAGPVVGGTGGMIFEGASLVGEGEYYRAAEKMIPKFARDILKAWRFRTEGVTNMRGDPVLPKGELSDYELALQAAGFTPAQLTSRYEENRAVGKRARFYQDRRSRLMKDGAMAILNGDDTTEAFAAISEFNAAVPEQTIEIDDLIQSVYSRQRVSDRAVAGLDIPNEELRARVLREIKF